MFVPLVLVLHCSFLHQDKRPYCILTFHEYRNGTMATQMTNAAYNDVSNRDALIESLLDPASYVHSVDGPVLLRETHISWVILAGNYAYKIKKPIQTEFLDYGSLEKRHHSCCEELRLGSRYAMGMYLDIVPITFEDGQVRMDGDAQPIEFAVRMRRFDDNALLGDKLAKNLVSADDVIQLAATMATIHGNAFRLEQSREDFAQRTLAQAKQNFDFLLSEPLLSQDPVIRKLESWTTAYFESHRQHFENRILNGAIRECHGDLHCGNIVYWKGHWVPFDGIEFNADYSWIDVMNDIAFLVMDLQEYGHPELSAVFLNAYLEHTGDYQSLRVLKWYLVYRALVRAKVAVMRARQLYEVQRLSMQQIAPARTYIRLAEKMSQKSPRKLWITHGVSGSGKTTGSLQIVEQEGAIRLRSDVERKRLFKTSRSSREQYAPGEGMYSPTASEATYTRLYDLTKSILQSGFNVIVDATFLKQSDRQRFRLLAESEGAEFRIQDFQAEEETLRQRITNRRTKNSDASDATLEILKNQLATQEPLSEEELKTVAGPE